MDFCPTFYKVRLQKWKSIFIQLQKEPLLKAIDQELLLVKNIV